MTGRTREPNGKRALLLAIGALVAVLLARPALVRADSTVAPWGEPVGIATGLVNAARPTVSYSSDGQGHALWESKSQIYYATRSPGGAWGAGVRVAAGVNPALVVGADNILHAIFANNFLGNDEIYYVTRKDGKWSLPRPVSYTSGKSASPALTMGADGTLYAAWMDNTPGYWVIYEARLSGGFWSTRPVTGASGQYPSIASAVDGSLFLGWQDKVLTQSGTEVYDIFMSQKAGGRWTAAVDVSDRPDANSLGVHLTATADSLAQLVWVDAEREVRYAFGVGSYWPLPQTVMRMPVAARGPRILAERGSILHIAWDEGLAVWVTTAHAYTAAWPKPELAASPLGNVRDVALAAPSAGGVSVSWVLTNGPGIVGIFESSRSSSYLTRAWFPLAPR